jgi:protoporphyrinogen oxidase
VNRLAASLPEDYRGKLEAVTYLGMVCVVLVLKRQLTPFYVLNLADHDVPFTGLIEMSNLVPPEELGGAHLLYLPKYTAPNDPLFAASDEEVWREFEPHLRRVCPAFTDADVESRHIFREKLVQPLPVLRYSDLAPSMETGIPNLFLANTTQIVNSTLNNNEMVRIARQAVEAVAAGIEPRPELPALRSAAVRA